MLDKCDVDLQVMYSETDIDTELTAENFFAERKIEDFFKAMHVVLKTSPIRINVNPHILNDMLHFRETQALLPIMKDLK